MTDEEKAEARQKLEEFKRKNPKLVKAVRYDSQDRLLYRIMMREEKKLRNHVSS